MIIFDKELVIYLLILVTLLMIFSSKYIKKEQKKKGRSYTKSAGDKGEAQVQRILKKMGSNYKVLNDINIPSKITKSGTTQIDHLVISKYGIFVVETKNYAGKVIGMEGQTRWLHQNRFGLREFLSPIGQNEIHIDAVKELLNEEDRFKIFSVIAFSSNSNLNLQRLPYSSVIVLRIKQIKRVITSKKTVIISPEQVDNYYNLFKDAAAGKLNSNEIKTFNKLPDNVISLDDFKRLSNKERLKHYKV